MLAWRLYTHTTNMHCWRAQAWPALKRRGRWSAGFTCKQAGFHTRHVAATHANYFDSAKVMAYTYSLHTQHCHAYIPSFQCAHALWNLKEVLPFVLANTCRMPAASVHQKQTPRDRPQTECQLIGLVQACTMQRNWFGENSKHNPHELVR